MIRTMRNFIRAFSAVIICVAVQGMGVSQRPSTVTATPDAIVFGDREWVYYLASNSSAPRKLAKGNFPALSPDRQRVAFCLPINTDASAPATGTVGLIDIATGKTNRIFSANAWLAHLRWAPDGNSISLSAAYANGKRELNIIRTNGAVLLKLAASGVAADDVFSPAWAPDGKSFYFHDMTNLFQVSVSGKLIARTQPGVIVGENQSVTSADSFVPCPSEPALFAYTRSVPGTRLFERTFGEPNTALFLYGTGTKSRTRLSAADVLALDPVWSRDGQFIYFSGYHDREGRAAYPFKIYRLGRNGVGLVQIVAGENPDT